MDISIGRIQEAVKRARQKVMVDPNLEDADLIIPTLAALEILQGHSQHGERTKPLPDFPETFAEWASNYELSGHNDQFITAIVYQFEKNQMQSVTTDDILQLYKKARWELPKNPSDVIMKAARRQHITEDDNQIGGEEGKKRWRITKTGYSHFQGLRKEHNDGN